VALKKTRASAGSCLTGEFNLGFGEESFLVRLSGEGNNRLPGSTDHKEVAEGNMGETSVGVVGIVAKSQRNVKKV